MSSGTNTNGVGQMLIQCRAVARNQVCHRHGCEMHGNGPEANTRVAIRVAFDDVVVGGLTVPALLRHVAIKNTVELQDGTL